jgi:hypothetical protein
MEQVEDFVLSNIQELVFLRLNQTEFKDVIKKTKAQSSKNKKNISMTMH